MGITIETKTAVTDKKSSKDWGIITCFIYWQCSRIAFEISVASDLTLWESEMKDEEELMRIFNKRDLWISSSVISGTLAIVMAILLPITGNNNLLPSSVIFTGIGMCILLTLVSFLRWRYWNKEAQEGVGVRDWYRTSM